MTRRWLGALLAGAALSGTALATGWDEPDLSPVRAGFKAVQAMDRGVPAEAPAERENEARKLMSRGRAELEALYRSSEPGPIPNGKSNGAAAIAPGTPAGGATEALFSVFWHGKVFDRKNGVLVNRLIIGRAVKAKVFLGPSWLDGEPAVIIDYAGTSWIAHSIRDEIRQVAPGVYLGFAYVRAPDGGAPRADILFALDFN